MNQNQLAEHFDTSKQNIGQHIANILKEKELDQNSVVKNFFTTATEIILDRADADKPNMALTSWKGSVVRKQDIFIAKNYLTEDEIDTLNRLFDAKRNKYKETEYVNRKSLAEWRV